MLYNPSKVAVAGVLVWASVWLIMPLEVTGYLSWGATFYIVGCYLALFAGVAMARPLNVENRPTVQWQIPYDPRLFWGTLTIGLLGLGLRLLDRVVFRGVEYGATALVLRETLEVSSVSFAGAVGAVLYVMCMIPLVVLLTSRADRQRVWLYLLATVTFVLPVLESLAQLSRSFMLVAIGFGFGAVIIARFGGNPFNRRIAGAAVTAILVIGVASTLIFSARLELSERRLDDSIFESVYAENLQPNINANVALSGGGRAGEEVFYRTILPNGMYYLSGMYEFTTLWDRPDRQPFAFGVLHFQPILKAVQIFFPDMLGNFDAGSYLYRVGTWQTFFGPVWADFGYFGLFFVGLIGAATERMASAVRRGYFPIVPLYIYMIVVIFFMPVVNLLISGFGLFTVVSFAVFAVFTSGKAPEITNSQRFTRTEPRQGAADA